MMGALLVGLGWAGASADMNVMLPALRRAEQGDAELALHQGITAILNPYGPGSGSAVVSGGSAGFAPADHLWVEVRGGAMVSPNDGSGIGIAALSASYALVDTANLRTGPQLQLGFAGSPEAPAMVAAPGWSLAAGGRDATLDVGAALLLATPELVGTQAFPLWEVGLTLHPGAGPHHVRIGVAEFMPNLAYRYVEDRWFVGAQVSSLLLVNEVGVDVGVRF